MRAEHRAGRLVAWGNAAIAGLTSLDEAAARVCGADDPHRVAGLPGQDEPVSIAVALGLLRGRGAGRLLLALPRPGDPLGLPGPPEFNMEAMAAGEAVLTEGDAGVDGPLGLVPELTAYGPAGDTGVRVCWRARPVNSTALLATPSLAEAERELAEALRTAVDELTRLDVARWRPEAAEALRAIRERGRDADDVLAPGYPPRAFRVLALAQRLAAIVTLAGEGESAAVSAGEMAARDASLRPLERSIARAQLAAYNAAEVSGRR